MLRELQAGRRPHVVGGVGELDRMLRGVEHLKRGEPTDVAEFFGFADWNEVAEHSKTPEGRNLRTFVGLVDAHGERHLIQKLNETQRDERGADVVVSTAHKAKGREWETVELVDDFLPSQPGSDPDAPPQIDEAEVRLFYVALTRAKIAVEVSSAAMAQFGMVPGRRFKRARPHADVLARRPVGRAAAAASAPEPLRKSRQEPVAEPVRRHTVGGPPGWIWLVVALGALWLLFS